MKWTVMPQNSEDKMVTQSHTGVMDEAWKKNELFSLDSLLPIQEQESTSVKYGFQPQSSLIGRF